RAALQAQQGLHGARNVFERRGGYGDAYFSEADWGALGDADGALDEYVLRDDSVIYKLYPVQLPLLTVVDTALDARSSGVEFADLADVELVAAPLIASRSNPRPDGGHAAKF